MRDVPVYLSGAAVAKMLKLGRNAVYNAFNRGSIQAAAYVDDVPVFTMAEVEAWRASRYQRRNTLTR